MTCPSGFHVGNSRDVDPVRARRTGVRLDRIGPSGARSRPTSPPSTPDQGVPLEAGSRRAGATHASSGIADRQPTLPPLGRRDRRSNRDHQVAENAGAPEMPIVSLLEIASSGGLSPRRRPTSSCGFAGNTRGAGSSASQRAPRRLVASSRVPTNAGSRSRYGCRERCFAGLARGAR